MDTRTDMEEAARNLVAERDALAAECGRLRAENTLALGLLCDIAAGDEGATEQAQAWLLARIAIADDREE
jgi:hypothetical protein